MRVIEFFGMPRAGKTEQIIRLSSYLKEKGIKHLIITDREIEKDINIPLEAAFEYNIVFFNKILENLLSAKHSGKYDLVILDRGFLDGEVWFNIEHKQNNLSDYEKETANKYIEALRKYVDVGVFIIIDTTLTIKRHESKGEVGKADDYVLKNYVEGLHQEYLNLKKKFQNDQRILLLEGHESIEDLHSKIINKLRQDDLI